MFFKSLDVLFCFGMGVQRGLARIDGLWSLSVGFFATDTFSSTDAGYQPEKSPNRRPIHSIHSRSTMIPPILTTSHSSAPAFARPRFLLLQTDCSSLTDDRCPCPDCSPIQKLSRSSINAPSSAVRRPQPGTTSGPAGSGEAQSARTCRTSSSRGRWATWRFVEERNKKENCLFC